MACDDISMTMRYTYSAPERSPDALCRLEYKENITIYSAGKGAETGKKAQATSPVEKKIENRGPVAQHG